MFEGQNVLHRGRKALYCSYNMKYRKQALILFAKASHN